MTLRTATHDRGLAIPGMVCVLLALTWPAPIAGQLRSGEIAGRVVDADEKPIPGVTITIHPASGAPLPGAQTQRDGAFRVSQLAPGTYRVKASITGFITVVREDLSVTADARTQLTLTMAVGAIDSATAADLLKRDEVGVQLATRLGIIFLAIDTAHAPLTAANFLKYVDGGFYDGGRFHRATRPDNYTPVLPNRPPMEIVQAGINPARRAEGFPAIPLERTSLTGLKHVTGTVSMARGNSADTATSDFFICLDDQPSLDFGGKRFDDGQGGAAFGRVVSGLDTVRRIQQQPVQAQALTPPVPIVGALRFVK
jgi:peptidyl-prolyl cis-trans isomerase A (cyclophilin A)